MADAKAGSLLAVLANICRGTQKSAVSVIVVDTMTTHEPIWRKSLKENSIV